MAPTGGTRLRMKYAKSINKLKTKKIPSLKNQIRSLERYLQRKDPEDPTHYSKQQELERLLKQIQEKNDIGEQKKIVEISKKPRFFERVKLMRKLGKLTKKLEEAAGKTEKKKMNADVNATRRDLMYVFYYPKTERYIPLFPTAKPLDDVSIKRQEYLKKEAVKAYEKDISSHEKFEIFCAESSKTKSGTTSSCNLIKRPLKVIQKKKKKKHKQSTKANEVALVDQDGSTSELSRPTEHSKNEGQLDHDSDFFLE